MNTGGLETLLLVVLLLVVLFAVTRRALLWYWRVDESVALLKDIAATLARIERQAADVPAPPAAADAPAAAARARIVPEPIRWPE